MKIKILRRQQWILIQDVEIEADNVEEAKELVAQGYGLVIDQDLSPHDLKLIYFESPTDEFPVS